MPGDAVHCHSLFFQKDVQTDLQRSQGGIQVRAHEVGKIELAVRCTHKHRTAFFKSGNMLSGEVVVSQKSAAVLVAFQGLII